MTPIALYLAQQLEDTNPNSPGAQLLMYNAADQLRKQRDEVERLENAIRETIEDNLNLVDGDTCTLIKLKRVINYT